MAWDKSGAGGRLEVDWLGVRFASRRNKVREAKGRELAHRGDKLLLGLRGDAWRSLKVVRQVKNMSITRTRRCVESLHHH